MQRRFDVSRNMFFLSVLLCSVSIGKWILQGGCEYGSINEDEAFNHPAAFDQSSPRNQRLVVRHHGGNRNKDILRRDIPTLIDEFGNAQRPIVSSQNATCKCVNCKEDALCGRLWHGNQAYGARIGGDGTSKYEIPIHVVVSYCRGDLNYVSAITEGYNIASIHVISKCGYEVKGVDSNATIEVLPNVGRCDHSYAHYITTVLDQKLQETGTPGDDSLVLFLKDNAGGRNLHQLGFWNSFSSMTDVASSQAGFSCGMIPGFMFRQKPIFQLSAFFEVASLKQFQIMGYTSKRAYDSDNVTFASPWSNWRKYYEHLVGEPIEQRYVQVCFGGVFMTSVKQIKKQKMHVWRALEESLSRGDNIQEGHYAERIWAVLLAEPLLDYQIEAILKHSDEILKPGYQRKYQASSAILGAVVKKRIKRVPQIDCNSVRHCWIKQRRK